MINLLSAGVGLHSTDADGAIAAWRTIETITDGSGGAGGEALGAPRVLLVSWAGLSSKRLPRALNWLGMATGSIGLVSMMPPLRDAVIAFFIFGAMAFRRGWFDSFPVRRGMTWLAVGVAAAIMWYAWSLVPHGVFNSLGLDISYLVWEETVCFGMCIGLLVLFRQAADTQGRFGKMLAANQYAAYFWHPS